MPRGSPIRPAYLAIAAALLAIGIASVVGCRKEKAPEPVRLVLTADIRGRLVPCGCFTGQLGGMTRLFTELGQARTGHELRLDAGDALQGTQDFEVIEYAAILKAFAMMDFQALNIGRREAELNAPTLLRLKTDSNAPLISANLFHTATNEPVLPTHIQTEIDGKTVIITGILHPGSAEGIGAGLHLGAPDLVLKELLPKLRKESDLLILLAFAEEDRLRQLAEQFYELDFILGGDVSQPSGNTRLVNQSQVFYVANESRTIGLIDFELVPSPSHNNRPKVQINNARPVLLYDNIPEAPEIVRLAAAYRDKIRETTLDIDDPSLQQTAQVPGIRPSARYVGTESCVGCHQEAHMIWEDTGHAHAWMTLQQVKADADPNCIGCHSVGFGSESGYRREFKHEKLVNVGCESCHGPGSQHVAERSSGGPVHHRFRPLGEGDCRSCHYGEFSRPFEWDTFWPHVAHGGEK